MIEIAIVSISIALNLFVGLMVMISDRSRKSAQFFSAFTITISAWSAATYWSIHPGGWSQLSIARIVMLLAAAQCVLIYLAVTTFPNKSELTSRQKTISALGVAVAVLTQTPLLFASARIQNGHVETQVGPAITLFILLIVLTIGGALEGTLRSYRDSNQRKYRAELKIIGIGLLIAYALILAFNLFAMLVFRDDRYTLYGASMPIIFALSYTYAILRNRLYDVPIVLFRAVAYAISFSLTYAWPFIVFLWILGHTGTLSKSQQVTVAMSTIVFATLSFRTIRDGFDNVTDSLFKKISTKKERQLGEIQKRVRKETAIATRRTKKLELQNASKDEFISLASHQLRTPISIASMNNKMILEGLYGEIGDEQKQAISESQASIERMQSIVDELLEAARVEEGTFTISKSPEDVVSMSRRIASQHRMSAKEKGITIRVNAKEKVATASIDGVKIGEVISNMIDNAVKYAAQGTTVQLHIAKTKNEIILKVTDKGKGVPRSEQDILFTRFGRTKSAKKSRPDGLGLGLYLAAKTVEAHGGRVIFESQAGKGSTFGFALPVD